MPFFISGYAIFILCKIKQIVVFINATAAALYRCEIVEKESGMIDK